MGPLKDVQNDVHAQLRDLKTDMIQYDKLCADYHATRELNEQLKTQFQLDKEKREKLECDLEAKIHAEKQLQTSCSQAEMELKVLQVKSNECEIQNTELQQDMLALQTRLAQAEAELQAASIKLQKSEADRKAEEQSAAQLKQQMTEKDAEHQRLVAETKQGTEKKQRTEMRDQLDRVHRQKLEDQSARFTNDMHRLSQAKKDQEESLKKVSSELDATKGALRALEHEKTDSDLKLEKASQALQENPSLAIQLASVKEQLEAQQIAVRAKDNDLAAVRKEHNDSQTKLKALEAQAVEQQLAMDSVRQENASQLLNEQRKHDAEVQRLQSQIASLESESHDSGTTIERLNLELDKVKTGLVQEKAILEKNFVDLQAAMETRDAETNQLRDVLKREMIVRVEACKGLQTARAEHALQMADAQTAAETRQAGDRVPHLEPSGSANSSSTHPDPNARRTRKPRARVDRQDNSVTTVNEARLEDSIAQANRTQLPSTGDASDNLFDDAVNSLAEQYDHSQMQAVVSSQENQATPGTQDEAPTSVVFADFSQRGPGIGLGSSGSPLSDLPADEDVVSLVVSSRSQAEGCLEKVPGSGREARTPSRQMQRLINASSVERPVSRANTASRIAPAPSQGGVPRLGGANAVPSPCKDNGRTAAGTQSADRSKPMSQSSRKGTAEVVSSPDYVHQRPSGSPITYGQLMGQPAPSVDGNGNFSPGVKRTRDPSPADVGNPAKRQRAPASQAPSVLAAQLSQAKGSHHSQSQMRSSAQSSQAGSKGRKQRRKTKSMLPFPLLSSRGEC